MALIHVCNLRAVPSVAAEVRPSHLVSMVRDEMAPPTPPGIEPERHLRVDVDDIVSPLPGAVLPAAEHVQDLIDFAQTWDGTKPMLIHCAEGISRSTAAALVVAAVHSGRAREETASQLRHVAPHARPNPLIMQLADEILGHGGALEATLEIMGDPDPKAVPRPIQISIER